MPTERFLAHVTLDTGHVRRRQTSPLLTGFSAWQIENGNPGGTAILPGFFRWLAR